MNSNEEKVAGTSVLRNEKEMSPLRLIEVRLGDQLSRQSDLKVRLGCFLEIFSGTEDAELKENIESVSCEPESYIDKISFLISRISETNEKLESMVLRLEKTIQ